MPKLHTLTISFISFAVFILWLFVGHTFPAAYVALTDESVWAELATALIYIAAGIILLYFYLRLRLPVLQKVFPILLALFFVFVGGEEESWGMWIFDYSVSEEMQSVNAQNETNIHNLNVFSGPLSPHVLLNLFVILYGVITPLACHFSRFIRDTFSSMNVPIAQASLSIWFAVALAYEKIALSVLDPKEIEAWRHTEVSEFLFSIGFLVLVLKHIAEKRTAIYRS